MWSAVAWLLLETKDIFLSGVMWWGFIQEEAKDVALWYTRILALVDPAKEKSLHQAGFKDGSKQICLTTIYTPRV